MASPSGYHEDRHTRNVADPFQDLLSVLDDGPRRGFVQRLATGYYEGWQPTRAQVANLIAREMGRITEDEYVALLRVPNSQQEPRQDPPIDGSSLVVREERSRTGLTEVPYAARAAGGNRAQANPLRIQAFTVACGELAARSDFVARGLSSGGWVQRSNRMYRLVSLHYELIPRQAVREGSKRPVIFTAPITCMPDTPAPHEPSDGQSVAHTMGSGRVIGVRGPWPVSPGVRQLKFLIYQQAPPDHEPDRQPAGALWVDLKKGEAHWRQVSDRRTSPNSAQQASVLGGSTK